jgi:hypothetical protein
MESDVLSDREKAAVLWAEHVTRNTARDRDDVFAIVSGQFTQPEIVELTLMSGLFAMFNRLMDSLKIPVELQDEVDKIQRSLHLAPEKVKAYFETVVDTWPESFPEPHPD